MILFAAKIWYCRIICCIAYTCIFLYLLNFHGHVAPNAEYSCKEPHCLYMA